LIKVDRLQRDSELKNLSAAVQAIRENPDPKLFKQLVLELDDGTLQMRSLLTHIILNDHDILALKPWGEKEEAIAIDACIDALPLADENSKMDLAEILLRAFGGGDITIVGKDGRGRNIRVTIEANGYSLMLGGEGTNPLSIEDAQQELRRLYKKSKAVKGGAD